MRGGRPLECFTIGFHDDRYRREGAEDDLPFARRVAADLGLDFFWKEGVDVVDGERLTGERLLLIAPNGLDWIVVRLAAGAAGLMTVALDHLAQGAEIV